MKHKPFFWFVLPSALAMLLFIFFPIVSVLVQSVHVDHEQVIKTVETCDLFGCKESTTVDQDATAALRAERPLGQFAGLTTYADINHLAINKVGETWQLSNGWRPTSTKPPSRLFFAWPVQIMDSLPSQRILSTITGRIPLTEDLVPIPLFTAPASTATVLLYGIVCRCTPSMST